MKIQCPSCGKQLAVAEKHSGRTVRCPACQTALKVPQIPAAVGAGVGAAPARLDLTGLAALEKGTTAIEGEELAVIHAEAAARKTAKPGVRICPTCKKPTPVHDLSVDVLCSHCWQPIPATESIGAYDTGGVKLVGHHGTTAEGSMGFYAGLAGAIGYPLQAFGSILLAIIIAIVTILVPVALMTALASTVMLSDVGTTGGVQEADLSNVQIILRVIFVLQVFFFSAVGLHAFLDVTRTTAVGQESPPTLTWNPGSLGKSLVNLLAMLLYVGLLLAVIFLVIVGPEAMDAFIAWDRPRIIEMSTEPRVLVPLVFVIAILPMHMIGMALGSIGQALNPVNVFKSIFKTHSHYLFLIVLMSVYGGLSLVTFAVILDWFLGKIDDMTSGSGTGALGIVALGLLSWGLVMGFVFYVMYVLGRLHGLFARSFRKRLLFGER